MMKRFLTVATMGLVLAGCGAQSVPSLATGPKVTAPITAKAPSASGRTGAGNPFSVNVQSHGGPAVLYINYDDKTSYFNRAICVNAYAKVWTRSGQVVEIHATSLNHPSGGTSVYGGYATIPGTGGVQDIQAVEFAFYRGDRWDSNFGRNYRATF